MSDAADPTRTVTISSLAERIAEGTPPPGPSEAILWTQARELAVGVAYTWINKDTGAQDALLDKIIGLGKYGAGVSFAVDLFTAIKMFGIQPGMFRSQVEITTYWTPPADATDEELATYSECVQTITDLWTGLATQNQQRAVLARDRMWTMPLNHVREILRIMAFDAGLTFETCSIWNAVGGDAWAAYRRDHPVPGKWEAY